MEDGNLKITLIVELMLQIRKISFSKFHVFSDAFNAVWNSIQSLTRFYTAQKMKFSMRPNPKETTDFVTFAEEIIDGKLYFLCSVSNYALQSIVTWNILSKTVSSVV